MATTCDLLFVYGTLLSGDTGVTGRAQRARLSREARLVGMGTTPGRLYNLGRYPGLVVPGQAGEVVHGEVLALFSPHRTLLWLDVYEGIVPGQHPHNDYDRARVGVTLDGGEHVETWGYIYRASVAQARLIAGGRWL